MEVKIISRGNGRSITRAMSYIRGEKLRDSYTGRTCYNRRGDVLWKQNFIPEGAPPRYLDTQTFCDEIEKAERRYDARTAREFICSLPNELSLNEQIQIIKDFVYPNFIEHGLCAAVAIHQGKNLSDPRRNNPHVHIIVSTRKLDERGFSKKKDREHDKKTYMTLWREQWARVQNRAYERRGLDIRVSHECLEVQGVLKRKPTIHLSLRDYQREKRGERTAAGDRKRAIERRNQERQIARDRALSR